MQTAAAGAQTERPGVAGPVGCGRQATPPPAALCSANLITANADWACAAVPLLLPLRRRHHAGLCGRRRLDPQQCFGLVTKAAELLVLGRVPVHPLDCLLVA